MPLLLVVVVHSLHNVLLIILDDVADVEVAPLSLHLVVVVQGIHNVLPAIHDDVADVEVAPLSLNLVVVVQSLPVCSRLGLIGLDCL